MKVAGYQLLVVSVLAVWIGGCAVDQKEEVATYRRVLDADAPGRARALDDGEELTLTRAMVLANQENEQLGVRGEDYLQALIGKQRAFAGFLPTVSLVPTYTWLDKAGSTSSGTTAGGGTGGTVLTTGTNTTKTNAFNVPVTGQINLFNGFRDVNNLGRSDATIAQQRQLLLDLQSKILLDVAQTYYQVMRSERQVDVLKGTLELQNARVHEAQVRLDLGQAIPLDLAQSQAQAANTQVLLTQAESDVRNGRTTLAFLIGAGMVNGRLVDRFAMPTQLPSIEGIQDIAQKNRRDFLAAQDAVRAARYNVDIAIGEYYPSVTFNAEAFLHRDPSDLGKWNAVLSANLPIFTGGLIQADVRFAWSQLRQALMSESLTRRQVLQDVALTYENLSVSGLRVVELERETAAARESLRLSEQRYKLGGTNLDVQTAQDTLLNAELQYVSEQFNQKVFYLDLMRVAGRMDLKLLSLVDASPQTQPATMPATRP